MTSDHSSAAEVITEILPFRGGRRVRAHLPADPVEAVVFAGDGQLVSQWGEFLNSAPGVPPTALVTVDRVEDELGRLHEYSPGFDPDRFAQHEQFFVDTVRQWTKQRLGLDLPPERTAIFGVSASAELALALGLRHPDVYSAVLAASPGGGFRPADTLPEELPRTYLTAGTEEPWFAENAARWADALTAAGGQVVSTLRPGDHGDPFWREELPAMVCWATPRD